MKDDPGRNGTRLGVLVTAVSLVLLAGCGGKSSEPAASAQAPAPPAATAGDAPAAGQPNATPLAPTDASWTPEALEQLLAPVALYPDVVLLQVLTASTNPQEVLDAGNWLIANASLSGSARDDAASTAGFTPPVRGLIQAPDVIDQMCLNMGWTEELGQAYVNDQAGVMDAVQRLRTQAKDVGTLASSDKLKVETAAPAAPSEPPVIKIESPSPQVVYVPQYDPVTAYAPPAAPAATTTTTTTTTDKGHSTGSLIATGVLAFGAGILVNEIFDDDDDDYWDNRYYGNMWYRPPPYYPPYPYRPSYGGGFYPGYGYNRPPSWGNNGWGNNNTVIINQDNNYWNRYDDDRTVVANRREPTSPISAAKPNRPELQRLNAEAAKGPKRPAPTAAQTAESWKGQKGYAGADPAKRAAAASAGGAAGVAKDRVAASPGAAGAAKDRVAAAPKVQGTYAGARPTPAAAKPAAAKVGDRAPEGARTAAASKASNVDRGRAADAAAQRPSMPSRPTAASRPDAPSVQPKPATRPAAAPAARPAPSRTAVAGSGRGADDRAASARGRASTGNRVPAQSSGARAARGR